MPVSAKGPRDWADAAEELAAGGGLAASLLERHGPPTGFRLSTPAERFAALARTITYQQLSGRAAGTIWARFVEVVGDPSDPAAVAAASHDALRGAGLSNAKARSMADLARHVLDRRLDLRATALMDDEHAIEALTAVRGIGPWSAQMFLISSLGRTDVWPTGDVGVRNGWMRATGSTVAPNTPELVAAGEPHRPYRTVLAWWCWREADTMVPA